MEIFPLPNQAGKVVEQLRSCLSKYNWARLGLGMPLVSKLHLSTSLRKYYAIDCFINASVVES